MSTAPVSAISEIMYSPESNAIRSVSFTPGFSIAPVPVQLSSKSRTISSVTPVSCPHTTEISTADGDGLTLDEGLTLTDSDDDGDKLAEPDADSDDDGDRLAEPLADSLAEVDADSEALSLALSDTEGELDGDRLAEPDVDSDADSDALLLALGDRLALPLDDADGVNVALPICGVAK